jgi:hypothetical protein
MFDTSHPSAVLTHLRVPHRVLDLNSTPRLGVVTAPRTGRTLVHVVSPAREPTPAARFRDVPIFAPVLADDALLQLLPKEGWERDVTITAADGSTVGWTWRHPDGDIALPFDPNVALINLLSESYAATARGRGVKRAAMRAYYRLRPFLPRSVQLALRRRFAVLQARTSFPRWPVETAAHDLFDAVLALLGEIAEEPVPWIAPWPEPYRWALVLTHDVEQQVGCDNVSLLRDIEEARGFRSTWNFVPRRYDTPDATVRDLLERGFEVGVHGVYHDGRDLESRELLLERMPAMREAAERWHTNGFRSPATHRDWDLMQLLPFDYDSSYLDTDPFEPQGGGSCTWWPFFIGELVELPITLLMDHTLFEILRRDESVWIDKTAVLREHGGMALLITHPDYFLNPDRLAVYDRFLAGLEDDQTVWRALAGEVATWWHTRAELAPERDGATWRTAAPGRVLLGPRAS